MKLEKNESSPRYLRINISAATEKSKRKNNQDCYGFSDGCETVTSIGHSSISHNRQYEQTDEFIAVLADGVSRADHPPQLHDDAAAIATEKILYDLFYEYSLNHSELSIADEINDTIIHASDKMQMNLAAAISVIGIYPDSIRLLNLGDISVVWVHNGIPELITAFTASGKLTEYAGNQFRSGSQMAEFYILPAEPGDVFILMTDGITKTFVNEFGTVKIHEILRLVPEYQSDIAVTLIQAAAKTGNDNLSACVIQISDSVNYAREEKENRIKKDRMYPSD